MPARRKSAQELILSGAAKAKPGRYAHRLNEPEVKPLGRAPESLTREQRIIWRQIVHRSAPGVLAASDCFLLELAVRLLDRVRRDLVFKASEYAVLATILGKLGLSPNDRLRMGVSAPDAPKPNEDDPWERF